MGGVRYGLSIISIIYTYNTCMITPKYSDDSIPYLHLVENEMGCADYLHVHRWSSSPSHIICMNRIVLFSLD